jgi:hypothetical protein
MSRNMSGLVSTFPGPTHSEPSGSVGDPTEEKKLLTKVRSARPGSRAAGGSSLGLARLALQARFRASQPSRTSSSWGSTQTTLQIDPRLIRLHTACSACGGKGWVEQPAL